MKVILVATLLSNPSLMVQAWHAHQHMHMHMHTRLTSSSSSNSHSSHSRTQLASSKDSPQDPKDVNADAYQRYHRSCFESNDNGSDSDNSNNDISASRRSAASERYPQFQRDLVHDNDSPTSPTSPSSPTSPTPLPNSILSNLEHSFDLGVILDQGLIHVTSTTTSTTTSSSSSSNSVDVKNRLPLEEWMDDTTVGVYSDYADWSDLNQVDPCINDQCEQCEIPEDYKQTSINIDVLDYLGIQRVKPLQVNRNRHGHGHGRREDI